MVKSWNTTPSARFTERGSIPGFVIVGILLTTLLIGGIYLVGHNLPRQNASPTVAVNDGNNESTAPKESENADSDKKKQDEAEKQAAADREKEVAEREKAAEAEKQKQQEAESAKSAADAKAQADAAAKAKSDADAKAQAEAAATKNQTANLPHGGASTSTATQMPQTGPTEVFMTIVGASVFIGVAIAYLRSHYELYGSF